MYDHYIAIDWAQSNMALARMTKESEKISFFEGPADVSGLKIYFKALKGSKVITIEESTASQWLYVELKDFVDKIVVCDPYRNSLLSEGAKSDKIDAQKLVQLLRANLLKEVFHTANELIYVRKIVSAYDDLIGAGIRLKNQRSALFRARGLNHKSESSLELGPETFVLEGLDKAIENYETERARYEFEFKRLAKKHAPISLVKSLPGIGSINAVKIVAYVVDPRRFKTKNKFLSYCGLIKHDRVSGGKSYGKKSSRCCRALKQVFKTAAITAIPEDRSNPLKDYYQYLMSEKKYAPFNARNAVARRIAILTWGVLKGGRKFEWCRSRVNEVTV